MCVSTIILSWRDLVIKIPRIPLVVLVAAVFRRGFLPLCVISHVMLKDAGESHGRQHAHHRSQCQHQTHHHAGEIDSADGIQGHWEEREKEGGGWEEEEVGRDGEQSRQRSDKEKDGVNVKDRQEMGRCVREGDKDMKKSN